MMELGLGEALAIETKRKQAAHETTLAAIGSAFSKGTVGRVYAQSLEKVLDAVKDGRRRARGLAPEKRENQDWVKLKRVLGRGRKKK